MRTILFVCSGNTCRSPMAEAIARHWTSKGLLGDEDVFIASAGAYADEGSPPSRETLRALERWKIHLDGASKTLNRQMIENADLVLVMGAMHVQAARELVRGDADQIAKIDQLDPEHEIDDPIGQGQAAYDALAERFMELIPRRLKELLADENCTGSGSSRG